MKTDLIQDVSDTALWVATYRARETKRPDALFQDPYADRLTGDKGHHIANNMVGAKYTAWAVVIRTCIIDSFIQEMVKQGVDTIWNLGTGLDSRPYRMNLPKDLNWVEVDYPNIIDLKEATLKSEKPTCQLQRIKLDLADREKRQKLFAELAAKSKNILVLTEGVVPYLTEEDAASLADDLRSERSIRYWILDYFSPRIMQYMLKSKIRKQMNRAPFKFMPADWFGFFKGHGWKTKEIKYLGEEAEKLGRPIPIPWIFRLLSRFASKEKRNAYQKFTAYVMLEPT